MKIEQLEIEKLTPYTENPRNISDDAVEAVAKSIKEFGFNQPLLVDQSGRICVGHTRFLAAKKLKLDKVPVHRKVMTEQEFTAYNIADNKTGEFSSWNKPLLLKNWEKLAEWPKLKDATGLQSWEIETPAPKEKDGKGTKKSKYDESIICVELIYSKEVEKELRELCNRLDSDAKIEDTILWCVKSMVKKVKRNA